MSDQPAIPAINVFPPFNPAPRRDEPAPEPVRDHVPPAAEQAGEPAEAASEPHSGWDAPAAATPMPWDFEAPAPEIPAAPAQPAPELNVGDEDDDLPWLEVPTPRAPDAAGEQEIRADDAPNFMDWVRTEETPPDSQFFGDPDDSEEADEAAPPIAGFVADAQPWAPEVENAADEWQPEAPAEPWKDEAAGEPWKAPESSAQEPWQAPHDSPADTWEAPADEAAGDETPWDAPAHPAAGWDAPAEVDVPEPELYDLPDVPPSPPHAPAPWTDAEAPLFEAPEAASEAEPAWELPADASAGQDQRPARESFAAETVEDAVEAEWSAPEAGVEPTPAAQPAAPEPGEPRADVSSAFAEVADRLQAIAGALRSDPAAFLAGARGGGDPLALLVTGFVLGYQARGQDGNS